MLIKADYPCLERPGACGAGIVMTEMVVFEWRGKAGTDSYKELLPLVK